MYVFSLEKLMFAIGHNRILIKIRMSQTAKPASRRGKNGSIYSIVGITLVLLIMGIMGWIFLNLRQLGNNMKEEIRISAYLKTENKDTIAQIKQYLTQQPYAKGVQYIDKEAAKKIWNQDNNEEWDQILDFNPLPESLDFYARSQYVNKDSLAHIADTLRAVYGAQISDIVFPQVLVNSMNEKSARLGIIFLGVAIILSIIVIVSIDNTIRLTMYSNRFIIKTMQMVGATRGFIAKPLDIRAVVNGIISAGIAIVMMAALMKWAERQFPQLKDLRNDQLTLILFGGMLVIGVLISLFSTHRSVMKYLRSRIDDLY